MKDITWGKPACKCIDKELYGSKYQSLTEAEKEIVIDYDMQNISQKHEKRTYALTYIANRAIIFNIASIYAKKFSENLSSSRSAIRREKECIVVARVKAIRNPIAKMTLNDTIANKMLIDRLQKIK